MIELAIVLITACATEAITQRRGNGRAYQEMADNAQKVQSQIANNLEQTKKISMEISKDPPSV